MSEEQLETTAEQSSVSEPSPRPWYFDGWDIFTTGPTGNTGGHRLVVPLPRDTFHPSQRVRDADARLIVRAVNAYDTFLDALSALRYIEERYGRLDGVGWERLGFDTSEQSRCQRRTSRRAARGGIH
jgi:hypothetical protein